MNFYENLLKALEENHIRYLVVGGVAVILHGFVRATADLDLFVGLEPENVDAFLGLMKTRGYKPKAPVSMDDFRVPEIRKKWKNDKGMIVFSFFHPQRSQELIDIFTEETIPFEEAYKRRVTVPMGTTQISVASREDLITLKQKAGRPQDLQDIQALKDVKGPK
jgi:predicted nucleotidyltransferase